MNGFGHDLSKFRDIEFEYMAPGVPAEDEPAKTKLKIAIHHHSSTNEHHPEYWAGGIKDMPDVYLAEFVCDTKARSEEFETDFRQWINESATKKWGFSETDEVYEKIMMFVDLLCDKPFTDLSK